MQEGNSCFRSELVKLEVNNGPLTLYARAWLQHLMMVPVVLFILCTNLHATQAYAQKLTHMLRVASIN